MTDGHRWIVDHKDKLQFFIDFVKDRFEQGNHLVYSIKPAGRTERQNNAMHLWFRQMAEQSTMLDTTTSTPSTIEVPFTEGLVKEMLYKPIIKAMYQKTSTTKLTGRELSEAAEVLVRWLSEKKGIYVPFPQSIKDEL